jgi:hypothetical protein
MPESRACRSYSGETNQQRALDNIDALQCPFNLVISALNTIRVGSVMALGSRHDTITKRSSLAPLSMLLVSHSNTCFEVEVYGCSQFLAIIIGGECNYRVYWLE